MDHCLQRRINVNSENIAHSYPLPKHISTSLLAVELVAKSREGESGEQQAKITQCNVEVTWNHEQIEYDQCEPSRDNISENPRLESDPNTCHDLDDSNTQH